MTTLNWHGPHLSLTQDSQEILRLGSVRPESVEEFGEVPPGYVAAGTEHKPMKFSTFSDARDYLSGPDNRVAVDALVWSNELFG